MPELKIKSIEFEETRGNIRFGNSSVQREATIEIEDVDWPISVCVRGGDEAWKLGGIMRPNIVLGRNMNIRNSWDHIGDIREVGRKVFAENWIWFKKADIWFNKLIKEHKWSADKALYWIGVNYNLSVLAEVLDQYFVKDFNKVLKDWDPKAYPEPGEKIEVPKGWTYEWVKDERDIDVDNLKLIL